MKFDADYGLTYKICLNHFFDDAFKCGDAEKF